MAGLLCSFQIIEVGAGTSFNVEEKDFIDSLYTVIYRIFEQPYNYSLVDFLAFLKCAHLVFVMKRQYSAEMISAFAKRLALLQMHMPEEEQAGILLLIKQIFLKYPAARSNLLEIDEDAAGNGFGSTSQFYRVDINDPALANVGQTHSMFEFMFTQNLHHHN